MKYDLISQINTKLQEQGGELTNSMDRAIDIIQNQKFPELDGLRLVRIEKYTKDEDNNKIITPPTIKLVLATRQSRAFSFIASTRCDYKGEEFTDVELFNTYDSSFYLTFTCDAWGKLLKHSLNYVYGNDIICYSYGDNNGSVVDMKSTMEIYINAAKDERLQYEHVKPLNLLPDISSEKISNKTDNYINFNGTLIGNIHYNTIIYQCRTFLNRLADIYHQTYEDYMDPQKRSK